MSNAYLVACHRYIAREIDRAKALGQKAESRGDGLQAAFQAGRMEELSALRGYLARQFNLTTQRYD